VRICRVDLLLGCPRDFCNVVPEVTRVKGRRAILVRVITRPAQRRTAMGRPPATDRDSIALVAVGLFLERGYDAVTIDDIAQAAGISRTTLWRHYRSKGEILWVHTDESLDELRAGLAAQPSETSLAEGAVRAFSALLDAHPGQRALDRARMRLIVGAPSTATSIWTTYQAWGRVFVEYVAARRGGSPVDVVNQTTGMMLWAALWNACVRWANSDDPTLDPHFEDLLAALSEVSL
jgi:AcrR family transcriptional regulator